MSENSENKKYIESNGKIYEIIKKIGDRNCGSVYLTKIKGGNELRVIKIYHKSQIRKSLEEQLLRIPTDEEMKELYLDRIYSEIENMKIMEGRNRTNNNTIKIFDHFENEEEIGLIMEACDDNFLHFLEKKNKFNASKIYEILNHLNYSFKIMAEKKLIHRSLSLENLIIKYKDQNKTSYIVKLKLIDDSILLSELIKKKNYSEINGGKPKYFAPEVLNDEEYDEKCDLWSLGVLIFELYFKELPFKGETESEVLDNINNHYDQFLAKLNEGKDPLLNDLIHKLMERDVNKRYNWKQYFEHPFFRKKEKCQKYYELNEKIGETKYAIIYKATEKETNQLRAIKIYNKNKIKNELKKDLKKEPSDENLKPYIDGFYREMELMKIIQGKNNDNAVKFYEYFDNDDEFCLVMELCDNNLFQIFLKSKSFTEEQILDLLTQLNNSFKIMYEKKLVHRALNLENILVKFIDEEKTKYIYKLKITNDSASLDNLIKNYANNKYANITGIINFIAPEILKGEKCDLNCDLWSLGIIIYALYFKAYPYNGRMQKQLLNDIKKIGKNFKKTSNENINDLINRLLNVDSKERITWEQYFNHPFFKKVNNLKKSTHKSDYKNLYEVLKIIDFSGYSTISKAKKRDSGELRAIKIYNIDKIKFVLRNELNKEPTDSDIQPYKDRFNNEIKYMQIIGGKNDENKNCITFYDSFENENEMGIIMELGDENLLNALIKRKKTFDAKEIYYILKQLNNSFLILHRQKLVHRSLNLSSILLRYSNNEHTKYTVKLLITDSIISLNESPKNIILDIPHASKYFYAPEILEKSNYIEKCDLWSLGIIIYELYFQDFPYKGNSEAEILNNIKIFGQNIRKIPDQNLNDLMMNLLNDDVEQRFGWDEYFRHPFFTGNKTNVY